MKIFYLYGTKTYPWLTGLTARILVLIAIVPVFILPAYAQNITRPNISGSSGLQVNSYTGSLFYQRTDMFIPGRGLSLDISFTYNSADRALDWGYGFGWTFYYNRFYIPTDTSIIFYNGDGRKDEYMKTGAGFAAPRGIFDIVSNYAAGKFKLTGKDGTQYFFDDAAHRKLTGITDRNNNTVTLTYSNNNLSGITDASGRKISLTWENKRMTGIKASSGSAVKQTDYTYDSSGTMITVKDMAGYHINYGYIRGRLMGSLTDPNGYVTNILYSYANAVTKFVSCEAEKSISYNTAEFKTYATDKNGGNTFVTTYTFDKSGNLINKKGNCCGFNTTYTYDDDNNINQVKDANENLTIYTYDSKGNLLSETDAKSQTILYTYEKTFNKITGITDKLGNKTEYSYDSRGNLLQIKEPLNTVTKYSYETNGDRKDMTDPAGNKTSFAYDAYGYVSTIKDAGGGTQTLSYDGWGNRATEKDANGHTTEYSYDALNRVVAVKDALGNIKSYVYDGNGNILSTTDRNGNKTGYVYDSRNKPILITDALNNNTQMEYDAVGNIVASTDAKGYTTTYTYDRQSRKESETNAEGDRVFYEYDGVGNHTAITYPNGNTVVMAYDALNRVTDITDKLGTIATYQYDGNNNKTTEADAKGNTVTYQYDALNRIKAKIDPLGNAYNYGYDNNGNIVTEKDRNGNTTAYKYDALNRLTQTTDALGFKTVYKYDAAGNMLSVTDARGNPTAYSYDPLNRTTQEKFADNTTMKYAYDAENNLKTRIDGEGQVTNYNYDKLYRPIVKSYPGGIDSLGYDVTGHLIKAVNGAARVLFEYDKVYRTLKENLNGKTTAYSYNISLGTKQIAYPGGRIIIRKMDERNQLKNISDGGKDLINFDYNAAGENIERRYVNGVSTSISYDANKQITDLVAAPSAIMNFSYSYDKQGNLASFINREIKGNSEQYVYDFKNQLNQAKKESVTQEYHYDEVGNRKNTKVNEKAVFYKTNNLNEYTSITGSSTIENKYDANGNLISDGITTFIYDIENRLVSINKNQNIKYTYDALGRRITKQIDSNKTSYCFDGLQVIEERNDSSLIKSYAWGNWLDDIVNMNNKNKKFYYHKNKIGSVFSISDSLGVIIERYNYDPFGKMSIYSGNYDTVINSTIDNRYTYAGREYDENGLYNYRLRIYNSFHGVFSQRDPMGYIDGMTNHSYAGNNPINRIDPLGLSWDDFEMWIGHIEIPFLQETSDLLAGLGDNVSGGFTSRIRDWMGTNNYVNKCSNLYLFGDILGTANSFFTYPAVFKTTANFTIKVAGNLLPKIGNTLIPIYRVYGGSSNIFGRSYSLFDPRKVQHYRFFAGLPSQNSGQYILEAYIKLKDIKIGRLFALPILKNRVLGGLPIELYQNFGQLQKPVIEILQKVL